MAKKDGEVERAPDPEVVQRSKLRIDTRKRLIGKLAPARIADKVDVNVSGTLQVASLGRGQGG